MPATKDKVAAANARAIDDRLAASSSAAIVSAPSGSRLNVPSGSASALYSAPSSPDVDISSSKADGKKKKGITSRLKKLFTPWNRSNSKLEGDNNSNGIKSTKSTSDMLQAQRETQDALCENRSLSHECVFNDDETSPVKPGPTHHKSMEVLSGGFAADLNKKIQLGHPPPKTLAIKVTAADDEQARSVKEHDSEATDDNAVIEQSFFQPWSTAAPSVTPSHDCSDSPDIDSLPTVDSGSVSLGTVSQNKLNVRQKNRRPVTMVGGQKLRAKLGTVLMMPDTLTEESDADDVSGPNTASSVPASTSLASTADIKPHKFQKKGDSRTGSELHSPADSSGLLKSSAQTAKVDSASPTTLETALMTDLAAGDESPRSLHTLAVDVSAQHEARAPSSPAAPLLSPTGSLPSPMLDKSPSLTSQVSPSIKLAEDNILLSNPLLSDTLVSTKSPEQLDTMKAEEQPVRGTKPVFTKPKPPLTAAKPCIGVASSNASATTPDLKVPVKGGVSVFPTLLVSSVSSNEVFGPNAEAVSKSSVEFPAPPSQPLIVIPRVSLTKQTTQSAATPEYDEGFISNTSIDPAVSTITIPRVRHPSNNSRPRPDVLLLKAEIDNDNKVAATSPLDETTSLKPSDISRTKKGTFMSNDGEDLSAKNSHLNADKESRTNGEIKRKIIVAPPSSALVTASKRQSYQEKDNNNAFHAADNAKAGSELSQAFKRLQQNKDTKPVSPADSTADVCADGATDAGKRISSGYEATIDQKPKIPGYYENNIEQGKRLADLGGANVNLDQRHSKDSSSYETSIDHQQPKISGSYETAVERTEPSVSNDTKANNQPAQAADSAKLVGSNLPDKEREIGDARPPIYSGPKSFRTAAPSKPGGIAVRGNTLGQTWSPGDVVSSKGKEPVSKEALSVVRKVALSDNGAGNGSSENLSLSAAGFNAKNMSSNLPGSEQTSKFPIAAKREGGQGVASSAKEDELSAAAQKEPIMMDTSGGKSVLTTRPMVVGGTGSLRRSDGVVAVKELEKMSAVDVSNNDAACNKPNAAADVKTDTKMTDEQAPNPRTMFGERSKPVMLKNGSLKRSEGIAMVKVLGAGSDVSDSSKKDTSSKMTLPDKTLSLESTRTETSEQVANARTMFEERSKLLVMGGSLKKSEASIAAKILTETSDVAKERNDKLGIKTDVELLSKGSLSNSKVLDPPRTGASLSLRRSDGVAIARTLDSMTASSDTLALDKETDGKPPIKPFIRTRSAKVTSSSELFLQSSSNKPSWIAEVQSKKANWSKLGDKTAGEENSSFLDMAASGT